MRGKNAAEDDGNPVGCSSTSDVLKLLVTVEWSTLTAGPEPSIRSSTSATSLHDAVESDGCHTDEGRKILLRYTLAEGGRADDKLLI